MRWASLIVVMALACGDKGGDDTAIAEEADSDTDTNTDTNTGCNDTTGTVSGVVYELDGETPFANSAVTAYQSGSVVEEVLAGSDGTWELELVAGDYTLGVYQDDDGGSGDTGSLCYEVEVDLTIEACDAPSQDLTVAVCGNE